MEKIIEKIFSYYTKEQLIQECVKMSYEIIKLNEEKK